MCGTQVMLSSTFWCSWLGSLVTVDEQVMHPRPKTGVVTGGHGLVVSSQGPQVRAVDERM